MHKLTQKTTSLLKNFSGISKNIMVRTGNKLSTISEASNILAFATVEEKFPQDFGIYDLGEFLGAVSLLDDPSIEFGESELVLTSGKSKLKYRFADESILTYPKKQLTMPLAEIVVKISNEILNQVRKAASVLGHANVSIKSQGSNVVLSVLDPKNATANTFDVILEENRTSASTFDMQFLIANLKMVPGDYTVSLSSKFISHWEHETETVEYFIALERTSTYEA